MSGPIVLLVLLAPLLLDSGQTPGGRVFEYAGHGGEHCCLTADFDGNGTPDYLVPVGEGMIRVYMNYGAPSERPMDIDAGGVAELYPPRQTVGRHGEPAVQHVSILIRWVGHRHVVYTWEGKGFRKLTFPAVEEPR